MRKCAVGGQAVMEGVMMKSDKGIAMAVRRADGKIVASYKNQVSKAQKGTFWGLPVIRGVVALVESLTTGMIDKQGRFLIPNNLRSAAELEKEAVIIGVGTRLEIWNKANWEKCDENISVDEIAENMTMLGI